MSLLRASLLGGVDGVITSFAIVAGTHAGELDVDTLWIIGVSSLVADGLAMGVSEYLSSSSARAKGEQLEQRGETVAASPLALGVACFVSFVLCGVVPTVLYALTAGRLAVAMFSLVELMLLGAARTRFTRERLLWGVAQTAALGAAAGAVAYGVGAGVHALTAA